MAGSYDPLRRLFTPTIETVEKEISAQLAGILGIPPETGVPIDREWFQPVYQRLIDTSIPRYARKTTLTVAYEYFAEVGEEELRRRIQERDMGQLAQPQPTPQANTDPRPIPPSA